MSGWRARAAALPLAWAAVACVAAPVIERLPLADGATTLALHWAPVDDQRRPVVVALHGCSGLYRRDGRTLEARYTQAIERLHAAGVHVLLPDSFGSRGVASICTQRYRDRAITVDTRRADVLAALTWAAARPEVDPQGLALLGWSNGGTTALVVADTRRQPAVPPLAAVMVFYPGCGNLAAVDPGRAPVLMQLGEADDWTPAAPCVALAQRWQREGRTVLLDSYPGAFHGFDGSGPVRVRADVPNGANGVNGVKGQGVHVGGQPEAAAASARRLDAFVRQHLPAPAAAARP